MGLIKVDVGKTMTDITDDLGVIQHQPAISNKTHNDVIYNKTEMLMASAVFAGAPTIRASARGYPTVAGRDLLL